MFRFQMLLAISLLALSLPLMAETLRDPTRPLREATVASPAKASFELNAILSSQQRIVAIINGKTVAEGDTLEGAKVTRIGANHVYLLYEGKPLKLRLHSSSVRSNAAVDAVNDTM